MAKARAVSFLIALAGLILFGWLSVQVYVSRVDPEGFRAGNGVYAWILGPPPDALREAAEQRALFALERLHDRSLPPAERLTAYREELRRAEELLVRSLRAQPAQAGVLAQLAAVRWELDPPLDDEGIAAHLGMIALASSMAPTVPQIQMQLGELLLKMGRPDEAVEYLARTVALNPQFIPRVIGLMRDNLFSADEILSSLPPGPELLGALRGPFLEDGGGERYVQAIEALLVDSPDRSTEELLSSYGSACLALGQAGRLREAMVELGALGFAEPEAARWQQLARASLEIGELPRAVEEARTAAGIAPDSARQAGNLGDIALAAGEPDLAVEAYREALALVARGSANPQLRARYYTKIGRAEESRGNPDRAYDAYKMALRLHADESWARRRIGEMEAAAGIPETAP